MFGSLRAELRFREAMGALLRCSPATVQPAELLQLFPDVALALDRPPTPPRAPHTPSSNGVHPASASTGRGGGSPRSESASRGSSSAAAAAQWGLAEPLPALGALVARAAAAEKLRRGGADANGGGGGGNGGTERRVALAAQQCIADYLLQVP